MLRARTPAAYAALALASLAAIACGGGPTQPGGGGSGGGGASGAVRIELVPAVDTIRSFHGSTALEASEADAKGRPVQPVNVAWRSTDTTVLTVSPLGRSRASVDARERDGTARVIASVRSGALADTAVITVRQTAASVEVSPDSARAFGAGDTVRFRAETVDGQGYPVRGYDVPLAWRSSRSDVAEVDQEGLVTSRGPGWSEILAADTARGDTARAQVWVYSPGPPVVDSVAPASLTETGLADVYGSDLGLAGHGDTVFIGGRAVPILAGDTAHLEVRVPDAACLPPHDAALRIGTPAGSTSAVVHVVPEEPPVSVAVGHQQVVRSPASEVCLQFPAASADERYLVGVQSRVRTPESVLSVDVVSRTAGDTAPAVSLPPISLALRGASRARIRPAPRPPSRRARWAEAEARLRRRERKRLAGLPALAASGGGGVSARAYESLPADLARGQTVRLRVPDLSGSDLCEDYTEITGVVRAVGERAYVISDAGDPDGGFTQADFQAFADALDSAIVPAVSGYFGDPTDIDGNGRVAAVFTSLVNQADPDLLGFEFSGDLYARSLCASSDEGEIFYANVPDPMGQYGPVYGRDSAAARTPWVMAHELTHVIQESRRVAAGLPFMGSAMAEAQATLGEEVAGDAATGRSAGQDYGYDVAFSTSASDSVAWYADAFDDLFHYFGYQSPSSRVAAAPASCGWWGIDPSPCAGRPLWYGVGWSFLRWVADRYGASGSGGAGLARGLIDASSTGPAEVARLVGVPLDDLLARWSASLWLDGRGIPGLDADL
ncbi:MAG TPA: hypothetical protein VKA44_00480, partial [Gemmatimonadota bacterium]|nr:hypothetical protein [Gemmatimonadota bacterium]